MADSPQRGAKVRGSLTYFSSSANSQFQPEPPGSAFSLLAGSRSPRRGRARNFDRTAGMVITVSPIVPGGDARRLAAVRQATSAYRLNFAGEWTILSGKIQLKVAGNRAVSHT